MYIYILGPYPLVPSVLISTPLSFFANVFTMFSCFRPSIEEIRLWGDSFDRLMKSQGNLTQFFGPHEFFIFIFTSFLDVRNISYSVF